MATQCASLRARLFSLLLWRTALLRGSASIFFCTSTQLFLQLPTRSCVRGTQGVAAFHESAKLYRVQSTTLLEARCWSTKVGWSFDTGAASLIVSTSWQRRGLSLSIFIQKKEYLRILFLVFLRFVWEKLPSFGGLLCQFDTLLVTAPHRTKNTRRTTTGSFCYNSKPSRAAPSALDPTLCCFTFLRTI